MNYTKDEFINIIGHLKWELVDDFTSGITKKYNLKCRNCGIISNFWGHYLIKSSPKCTHCFDNKTIYNEKLEEMGSTLRICSNNKVTTTLKKTEIECLSCGLIYKTEPRIVLDGHKCPRCNILRQRNVNLILNKSNINYKEYKDACRKIQRYNIINYNLFDMSDIGKYKFHIDHKYSLRDCFDENVNISLASSPINLQKLWWLDNIKKHKNSCITHEELLEYHSKWTLENGGEEKYLNNLKLGNIKINKNLL